MRYYHESVMVARDYVEVRLAYVISRLKERGFTQKMLAGLCGCSQQVISAIKRERGTTSISMLLIVADKLHMDYKISFVSMDGKAKCEFEMMSGVEYITTCPLVITEFGTIMYQNRFRIERKSVNVAQPCRL